VGIWAFVCGLQKEGLHKYMASKKEKDAAKLPASTRLAMHLERWSLFYAALVHSKSWHIPAHGSPYGSANEAACCRDRSPRSKLQAQ